jgi:hypothetical protein
MHDTLQLMTHTVEQAYGTLEEKYIALEKEKARLQVTLDTAMQELETRGPPLPLSSLKRVALGSGGYYVDCSSVDQSSEHCRLVDGYAEEKGGEPCYKVKLGTSLEVISREHSVLLRLKSKDTSTSVIRVEGVFFREALVPALFGAVPCYGFVMERGHCDLRKLLEEESWGE